MSTGINLIGSNQWQALQFQESARVQNAPLAAPLETRTLPNTPAIPFAAPTQTHQAVHLEAFPDHFESSLGDAPKNSEGGHESGGETASEDPSETSHQVSIPRPLANLEQALAVLAETPDQELRNWIEHLAFAAADRTHLAALLPTAGGRIGNYAHQANFTASPSSLILRILRECHRIFPTAPERAARLLTILQGACGEAPMLGALVEFLMRTTAEPDAPPLRLLEAFEVRLGTLAAPQGVGGAASKESASTLT